MPISENNLSQETLDSHPGKERNSNELDKVSRSDGPNKPGSSKAVARE